MELRGAAGYTTPSGPSLKYTRGVQKAKLKPGITALYHVPKNLVSRAQSSDI